MTQDQQAPQLEQVVRSPDSVARFWVALFAFGVVGGGLVTQVALNQSSMQKALEDQQELVSQINIGLAQSITQAQTYQQFDRERQAATDAAIQVLATRINQLNDQ